MTRAALLVVALLAGCAGGQAEGRPWVHDLTLRGVKQVKARDLKKKIAVQETSWVPLSPKKYLDPFTVETDRARIEAFYRARGFFDARVTAAEVRPVKGGKAVDVTITVDEGEPTHIDAVSVEGLAPLGKTGEALIKRLRGQLAPGRVFRHETYLQARQQLEARLKQRGYAWAEVQGRVEVDRDARLADVHLDVELGPRAVFGHVHVRGTERVSARDVAVHSNIREGARFDPDVLEEARGAIYNLGLFSLVKVDYEPAEGRPNVAEVIVTVRESTFNEIRIGLGLGIESQRTDAHAGVGYTRRNFRGGLRTLRLRLEPAWVAIPAFWNVQRTGPALIAEVELTQPDFIWPRLNLRWAIGYDIGIEYAYQFHGPRTNLGVFRRFWRDRVILGVSYNFQFLDFFATDPAILDDPAQAGSVFGYVDPYRLAWLQEELALDLRDQPLDAHKGLYLALNAEQGGPYTGSAFTYEKLLPEIRGYVPMGSRVTLAMRIMYGHLFSQGDLGSPITRRFYLGGPNTHRGFAFNRLSEQIPSGLEGVPPIPIGGDQLLLTQAELRVNIFRISGNWLSLAAFWDAGDVPPIGTPLSITNLHHAVGGGLRLKTLIGTVGADIGVRLNRLGPTTDGIPNPDPGQRIAFHFSVGEAF